LGSALWSLKESENGTLTSLKCCISTPTSNHEMEIFFTYSCWLNEIISNPITERITRTKHYIDYDNILVPFTNRNHKMILFIYFISQILLTHVELVGFASFIYQRNFACLKLLLFHRLSKRACFGALETLSNYQ